MNLIRDLIMGVVLKDSTLFPNCQAVAMWKKCNIQRTSYNDYRGRHLYENELLSVAVILYIGHRTWIPWKLEKGIITYESCEIRDGLEASRIWELKDCEGNVLEGVVHRKRNESRTMTLKDTSGIWPVLTIVELHHLLNGWKAPNIWCTIAQMRCKGGTPTAPSNDIAAGKD